MKGVVREGPIGVEIVRKGDATYLNYFNNGIQIMSHQIAYKDITMPEALVLLATEIRMGNVPIPTKEK